MPFVLAAKDHALEAQVGRGKVIASLGHGKPLEHRYHANV